jgi:hypothetical protein
MNARVFLPVSQFFLAAGSGTQNFPGLPGLLEKWQSGFDSSRESTVVRIGGRILSCREKKPGEDRG